MIYNKLHFNDFDQIVTASEEYLAFLKLKFFICKYY